MPEDPHQPEQPEAGPPEGEAPEGAPAEPAESTPPEAGEESAPEGAGEEAAPEGAAPGGAGEDVAPEAGDDLAPDEELAPEEPGEEAAPGPEIEGVEELAQAARPAAEASEEAQRAEEERPAEGEQPAAEGEEAAAPEEEAGVPRPERPRGRRRADDERPADEIIPGAHLEPDLVLEEQRAQEEGEYPEYGEYADVEAETPIEEGEAPAEAPGEPEPVARQPLDLAADARYRATGKRKSAVARVILKPGEGTYRINERHLDEYFPRVRLQRLARQPLEAAGYQTRMDVVARIHGGGVSAQAMALRHGVARALVEADPALRGELKRRGYLTRDPRVKERKKAGLKKARKRPQFSKR
jgi:small subunit ribosomal protein S9